jgi:hypothetical protein|tara:strand:+ start:236 stop:439 length:204 start_codon:yes stop_codon:yes gene_type:complete
MKSSYTNAREIEMNIDLGLQEMDDLIEVLEAKVEDGDNYRANRLLKSLKSVRSESIRQVQASLEQLA